MMNIIKYNEYKLMGLLMKLADFHSYMFLGMKLMSSMSSTTFQQHIIL